MPESKPNKRRTRRLNADAQSDIYRAKQRLLDVYRTIDPVRFNEATADAIEMLDRAYLTLIEVEAIHAKEAMREPYKNGNDDDD